jgi:hypothetical protein
MFADVFVLLMVLVHYFTDCASGSEDEESENEYEDVEEHNEPTNCICNHCR